MFCKIIFLPILMFSFLLTACHSHGVRDTIFADVSDNLMDPKNMLLNQSLSGINKILGDSLDLKSRFLFLYNSNDCETCLKKGFYLINLLDSIAKSQVVYIITSSPSIGTDQVRYGYKEYVYYEEDEFINHCKTLLDLKLIPSLLRDFLPKKIVPSPFHYHYYYINLKFVNVLTNQSSLP